MFLSGLWKERESEKEREIEPSRSTWLWFRGGVLFGRGYKSSARGTSLPFNPEKGLVDRTRQAPWGVGLRAGARHEPTPQASKQEERERERQSERAREKGEATHHHNTGERKRKTMPGKREGERETHTSMLLMQRGSKLA